MVPRVCRAVTVGLLEWETVDLQEWETAVPLEWETVDPLEWDRAGLQEWDRAVPLVLDPLGPSRPGLTPRRAVSGALTAAVYPYPA